MIDPLYLYGFLGGLVAYLLGRSRRGAFICGVLGVLWADIAVALINRFNGIEQRLTIGGAGVFDAMIISGLLGVVLAELIGELLERFMRGNRRPDESKIQNPVRQKER